jgi:hypothetical protein
LKRLPILEEKLFDSANFAMIKFGIVVKRYKNDSELRQELQRRSSIVLDVDRSTALVLLNSRDRPATGNLANRALVVEPALIATNGQFVSTAE